MPPTRSSVWRRVPESRSSRHRLRYRATTRISAGKRVLAFAGIADPNKFYRTVESLGAIIAAPRAFGDHQHLSDDEVDEILDVATAEGLEIVTTSKDFVRLVGGHGRAEELSAPLPCHRGKHGLRRPTGAVSDHRARDRGLPGTAAEVERWRLRFYRRPNRASFRIEEKRKQSSGTDWAARQHACRPRRLR